MDSVNQPPLESTEMNDRDELAGGIRPCTSMYYSEIQANYLSSPALDIFTVHA